MKPMKKALFIDRDGTIIAEPADEQIDSLEKLTFVPGAISGLKALAGLDFELVLAIQMFYTVVSLIGSLLIDISYGLVDPRVRVNK